MSAWSIMSAARSAAASPTGGGGGAAAASEAPAEAEVVASVVSAMAAASSSPSSSKNVTSETRSPNSSERGLSSRVRVNLCGAKAGGAYGRERACAHSADHAPARPRRLGVSLLLLLILLVLLMLLLLLRSSPGVRGRLGTVHG